MKKLKIFLLTILLFSPFNVLAYSDYVIPGGENIGIDVKFIGVEVIGFYKINNEYNENDIKIGDYIVKVKEQDVNSVNELINAIEEYNNSGSVELTIIRNNKTRIINFNLVRENNLYKTGLYVKDSITGIGTLSYVDPTTNIYGALGHEIIESSTNKLVEIKTGTIFKSSVSSIDRSTNGNPGTKNAKFYYDKKFGVVNKNTNKGIYGEYLENSDNETVLVGKPEEIKVGLATIRTVLDGENIKEYKINITKIDKKSATKNIYFEIVDEELLSKTGGIVQGMSGSPIMQDGKIIGAVTHVVVENVKKGYGIFITTMLEEGERQE